MAEKKESIKILIEADDLASFKMEEAKKNLEGVRKAQENELLTLKRQTVMLEGGEEALDAFNLQLQGLDANTAKAIARQRQHVRELQNVKNALNDNAKSTKVSAEFLGSFASMLGFGEIGAAAGQIGNLTDKTREFAEVAKSGNANLLLLKGGAIGLAALGGFALGKFLGDVIWQTEEWNKRLDESIKKSKELNSELLKSEIGRFNHSLAIINSGPESQRDNKIDLFIDSLNKQIGDIEKSRKELESARAGIDTFDEEANIFNFHTGPSAGQLRKDEIKREIEALTERHKALTKLRDDTQTNRSRASDIEESNRLRQQEIDAERQLVEEKLKAEEAERQRREEAINAEKRLADLYDSELKSLEKRRILMEEGAAALKKYELEQKGLSEEQIKHIMAMTEKLDEQQRLMAEQKKPNQSPIDNQARKDIATLQIFESRTLTRGPREDSRNRVEKGIDKTNDLLGDVSTKLDDAVKAINDMSKNNPPIRLKVR